MNCSPLYYESSPEQMAYLAARDPFLHRIIDLIGSIRRRIWPEPYAALLRAIIGQQISGKAQDAIWNRFSAAFPHFDPHMLAAVKPELICACGLSRRKASYMQAAAQAFAAGRLKNADLAQMNDEELQKTLGGLRGIGPWTVEMLLIFTFQRPNVLSYGDLAIQRGLCRLYGHERITREIFAEHLRRYSPCATLAGMYLWEMAKLPDAAVNKARAKVYEISKNPPQSSV